MWIDPDGMFNKLLQMEAKVSSNCEYCILNTFDMPNIRYTNYIHLLLNLKYAL